jgi:phosphoribosylglycinamide formyltransferase-1
MYGMRVHEAVLAANETVSGASVHLVDAQYDTGAMVAQRQVSVLKGDTAESLAARVQECERRLVVDVLRDIALDKMKLPLDNGSGTA